MQVKDMKVCWSIHTFAIDFHIVSGFAGQSWLWPLSQLYKCIYQCLHFKCFQNSISDFIMGWDCFLLALCARKLILYKLESRNKENFQKTHRLVSTFDWKMRWCLPLYIILMLRMGFVEITCSLETLIKSIPFDYRSRQTPKFQVNQKVYSA